MNAFGMIEVYGLTTALCAADVMVKAADVKLIAFDRNRPFAPKIPAPLIMGVKVEGSVAAVKAAVEAGEEYAKSKGMFIVSHVIARPDDQAEKMAYLLDFNKDKFNKKFPKSMRDVPASDVPFGKALGILEVSGFTAAVVGLDAMLNEKCKDQDTLALVKYLAEEEKEAKVLENQQILKTPIVRNGKQVTVGYCPEVWASWE